jgi:hypothetical protein
MILAIVGIILLLLVMLIAVRIGMNKSKTEEEMPSQIIHGSGIYSIIRRSPRENIGDVKPSQEEIRKYLSDKNVNISNEQQIQLLSLWNEQMEANISTIEKGDQQGAEFYYFEYKWPDHICETSIKKGRFVTREQIFDYPQIIPPFHLGCGCKLHTYQGKEKLHDTTEIRSLPLFDNGTIIPLPDWKEIIPIEKSSES